MVIRETGTPRPLETYRSYRRNNKIEWNGAEPDRRQQLPPLPRNEKNQVNFSKREET